MIVRVSGELESAGEGAVVISMPGGLAREVLAPAYLADEMRALAPGSPVTLHTIEMLESSNQGASFAPRLIGFASAEDRRVFELLITVRGLGPRKALKALTAPPGRVGAWIEAGDAAALQRLPGVGKKLAETLIADLAGKSVRQEGAMAAPAARVAAGPAEDAISALVALGESPVDADRLVRTALGRNESLAGGDLIAAALAERRAVG